MVRLLCVTPNPALDRTLTVPGFTSGGVFRTSDSLSAAGGKGLNVARAAQTLGAEALVAAPLGGHTGRWVAELAEREGIRGSWTWVDGETRVCTIIVSDGTASVINETGAPLPAEAWEQFQTNVLAEAADADAVCVSGSFPHGISEALCSRLISRLVDVGLPVWIDSSGMALRVALECGGASIKVNGDELGAVLGRRVETPDDALAAAHEARRQVSGAVIVTLGSLGAVMVADGGAFVASAPDVPVVSAVGSGDSFLAGLASAGDTAEGLRRAVAAGTANTLCVGGGKFSREDFERVLAATTVTEV